MKTIIIPKSFGYPTMEIIANGKHYELKSGEEITVEDHLAEIIENAVALVPKTERYKSRLAQLAEGSLSEITAEDLDGVETIAVYGLAYCKSLTKVVIPDSVKNIEPYAFYSCRGLKSLEIGESVKRIGNNAFDWCNGLVKVYLPEIPPTLENANAFGSISAACIFYFKTQASKEAYISAVNWSTLTGKYSFVVED